MGAGLLDVPFAPPFHKHLTFRSAARPDVFQRLVAWFGEFDLPSCYLHFLGIFLVV